MPLAICRILCRAALLFYLKTSIPKRIHSACSRQRQCVCNFGPIPEGLKISQNLRTFASTQLFLQISAVHFQTAVLDRRTTRYPILAFTEDLLTPVVPEPPVSIYKMAGWSRSIYLVSDLTPSFQLLTFDPRNILWKDIKTIVSLNLTQDPYAVSLLVLFIIGSFSERNFFSW